MFTFSQVGCAIRYHDAKTGTEHVWGLAHVKMRVAPVHGAPAPALATQTETFGLALLFGGDASSDSGLGLGWDRRTRVLVPDDSSLLLEWPSASLFDVRIGAQPPALAEPPVATAPSSP